MAATTVEYISQISTLWSLVRQAHRDPPELAVAARHRLLERYGRAVRRYLRGAVGDPDAADDLMQEFALRFLRGDFRRADPDRGRFRDFVRTALIRMIARHKRATGRRTVALAHEVVAPPTPDPADSEFDLAWRTELLERAWAALSRYQEQTRRPVYMVLRFVAEHPSMRSPEVAEELQRRLGKRVTAAGARQALHRARQKFAALLLDEVVQTLDDPSPDRVTDELMSLDLWRHCRSALK